MNDISMCLEHIADAIRNLDPFANPPVKVQSIQVGMEVGRCKNCNHPVKLRQPWLSKMPVVKDGYYLVHCSNEDCHNYYGMELLESQFGIADFVELEVNGQQYLLVHAGINNFSREKELDDYFIDDLVWIRPDYGRPYYDNIIVITGHTPTQLIPGNPRPGYIFKANNHIAMDCGACSPKGRLAGICLETGEEFYSR